MIDDITAFLAISKVEDIPYLVSHSLQRFDSTVISEFRAPDELHKPKKGKKGKK